MQKRFLLLKQNIVMFLDAASMTSENYDILDELESSHNIYKLTQGTVNTFIFFLDRMHLKVALSDLKMQTYEKRLQDNSPYIRL